MSEIAVENINVADILGAEGAVESVEQVKAAIESDAEVSALVKAAQSVEDVFEIVKKYAKATFEQVKVLFEKTVDYFKETKAALSDEVLDNVVGGWSLSTWWNENKANIIGTTIFLTCVAAGAVIGGCLGGFGGACAGAAVGVFVGTCMGLSTSENMKKNENK